jgi:hypothetical protein
MSDKVKLQSDGMAMFWCLGCGDAHAIPTTGLKAWGFNGDTETPTFTPSILCYESGNHPRCHSFVREGRQQFLSDCSHPLAGQTVEIPDWDKV